MKLILSDRPFDLSLEKIPDPVRFIDLSELKISNCVGCFGCWTKTPGKCVIRDDAVTVYPYIAKSDEVIYISHIRYGGYDTVMKTMLERAIPIQKAFIRLVDGETHHVQRAVAMKTATIIAYGNISDAEKEVFQSLVERNAHNMNFKDYRILFVSESVLEETVKNEVKQWEKS
jgi:multimeric flavodoxin WrbA